MPNRHILYEDELKLKQRQLESTLQTVAKTLYYDRKLHPSIRKLIRANDSNLCPIRDIEQTSSTHEYMTSCMADLGKTRSGEIALGLANKPIYENDDDKDKYMIHVLPMYDVDIYKMRDRQIVRHYEEFLRQEVKNVSSVDDVLHHWRPIKIFTNKKDEKLVTIGYHDGKHENENPKQRLFDYFDNGPGKECKIDYLLYEKRNQRWPMIIDSAKYELIIGSETKPFYHQLFGMKYHVDINSFGIRNIPSYETIYAEALKLCNLEPASSIFLHYFCDIGVLPILASQNVKECYAYDPNNSAIQTCLLNQKLYPHTNEIKFDLCRSHENLKEKLDNIVKTLTKGTSLTCVFGPPRMGVDRATLKQIHHMASVLRQCESVDRLIVILKNLNSPTLHLLYTLSGGESNAQKIYGHPFKPVLCIPFDSNARTGHLPDICLKQFSLKFCFNYFCEFYPSMTSRLKMQKKLLQIFLLIPKLFKQYAIYDVKRNSFNFKKLLRRKKRFLFSSEFDANSLKDIINGFEQSNYDIDYYDNGKETESQVTIIAQRKTTEKKRKKTTKSTTIKAIVRSKHSSDTVFIIIIIVVLLVAIFLPIIIGGYIFYLNWSRQGRICKLVPIEFLAKDSISELTPSTSTQSSIIKTVIEE
ncbi:unnamed protein product [Didymodactylos carnosus]|uniref:Uncharacterized protein n=1 Tax=Didymodactylos carnosus TaxID=1234261 RepID=A0A814FTX0_9BILA|nr:unnamed protein product [Didymodactylos carnosus]CAF0987219.1 unnamed protein product [Didymodactylos carnosus]CAF3654558.1 unnamed protein product [Didymodactylos carnosus]CAF3759380.1 unnamed protein product [Didymodactylos carnosus]